MIYLLFYCSIEPDGISIQSQSILLTKRVYNTLGTHCRFDDQYLICFIGNEAVSMCLQGLINEGFM